MRTHILFTLMVLPPSTSLVSGHTLNIVDFGAIPGDILANLTNREALTKAFSKAVPGDTGGDVSFRTKMVFKIETLMHTNTRGHLYLYAVLVPANYIFHSVGGIAADGINNITLQLVCF